MPQREHTLQSLKRVVRKLVSRDVGDRVTPLFMSLNYECLRVVKEFGKQPLVVFFMLRTHNGL